MIEIIREEDYDCTERKELPKDIKQIGKPDIGERIYMENQVYEFLHPYDSISEKNAYVLLGRFENYAGRQCTFVEAAIRLAEMGFDGELPMWNDQTWAYVYRQLKQEHDSMAIVGWAMDLRGMLPNLTVRMEALHQNNFGGEHQILFLMDSLEREETFYGSRSGHLYRREGFYIYYDKNVQAQRGRQPESRKPEKSVDEEEALNSRVWRRQKADIAREESAEQPAEEQGAPAGSYRRQILAQEEKQQLPSYATSLLLLVVVCAFGITAFANYRKMNAMQETLSRMNGTAADVAAVATERESETEPTGIQIEAVAGNVEKEAGISEQDGTNQPTGGEALAGTLQSEAAADVAVGGQSSAGADAGQNLPAAGTAAEQTAPAAETPAEQPAASASVPTEAQTYLAQGYYDVQKGDSLVGICKKLYQTTAIMDKLCEVNEIENENEIYAGQRLKLPN